MRASLPSSRFSLLAALSVSTIALAFDQGCAAFGDLPDYQLAPTAGAGGVAGATTGGTGGATSGAGGSAGEAIGGAGGNGGTSSGGAAGEAIGGAGGNGGTSSGGAAGEGGGGASGDAGAAGDAGSSGGGGTGATGGKGGAAGNAGGSGGADAGSAGKGGAGAAGANGGVGGASGQGGKAGASGGAGASGKAGAGGDAGASSGGSGGTSGGSGGGTAGTGGSNAGSGGSNAGTGGSGGAVGDPLPEIVTDGQVDPGTILQDPSNQLFWVNRANGGTGQVAKLALPGPVTSPGTSPNYVVGSIMSVKDIALFASRLFVLRGTGKMPQDVLISYQTNGLNATVIQACVNKPGSTIPLVFAVDCDVTATNRLIGAEVGVYLSGKAVGTDASLIAGTKLCGAAAGSCQAAINEDPPAKAMAAIGATLYSVSSTNPKQILVRTSGTAGTAFGAAFTDDVLDVATDATHVFALTSTGRVVAIKASDKATQVLVASGAGTGGQRIAAAGSAVYWTASDGGAGKGIVGRVGKDGTGFKLLTKDRQGPRGIAVDTSTGAPHVYYTDASDTVQRIRLP